MHIHNRCSSLEAMATGVACAAAPTDGASRTSTCRRTTSTTLDRGAMTDIVVDVLGAGDGCPLQHVEKVAASTVVLLLDVGW